MTPSPGRSPTRVGVGAASGQARRTTSTSPRRAARATHRVPATPNPAPPSPFRVAEDTGTEISDARRSGHAARRSTRGGRARQQDQRPATEQDAPPRHDRRAAALPAPRDADVGEMLPPRLGEVLDLLEQPQELPVIGLVDVGGRALTGEAVPADPPTEVVLVEVRVELERPEADVLAGPVAATRSTADRCRIARSASRTCSGSRGSA